MKLFRNLKLVLGGVMLTGLVACGGGGSSSGADSGTLRLALTDAPACGYDAVNVTVQKVRVHQSSSAGDSDNGWSEIVLSEPKKINLLSLQNGVLEELGQTPLPSGNYTQLRLVLADNSAANALANSVTPTGGTEVALQTPSGQQSGVKVKINIDIVANRMADFVLDFDACKSVVVRGGSGQYNLKPQLTVTPRYTSGVAGFVDAALANGSTSVSVQQGGVVIKASTPDSTGVNIGKFLLQPVAPGSYTLVLTALGRSTAIVTNVVVTAQTVTTVNASAAPLKPPLSANGTVTGTVSGPATAADALVRVQQPLTGGPTVQVAGRFVDGSTGAYSYPLVISAPQVAPYAPGAQVLVFAPDAVAAGKYTLNASLTGFADKTPVPVALTAGATIITNFTFP